VLLGVAADVVIKGRHAALETLTIMCRGIEWDFLKHGEPCAVPVQVRT
jgi:hypothetical protein